MTLIYWGHIFICLGMMFLTLGITRELNKKMENNTGEKIEAFKAQGSTDQDGRQFWALGYSKDVDGKPEQGGGI
jgi:hypothetical protein